jgi:hypothetical protein
MVKPMSYQRMSDEQRKVLTNATQVFEALENARRDDARFKGSMQWKTITGREYLYRVLPGGVHRSLGRRSPETERTKQAFESGRDEHRQRSRSLVEQAKLHASYVRANRLNRFPSTGARVVRALQRVGLPHRVIGTTALHVYEVSAGVLFLPALLSTEDMDVLVDAGRGIKIAAKLEKRTLLSLLRDADKTFRRLTSSPFEFTATNEKGYRVDFVSQGSRAPAAERDFGRLLQDEDIKPVGIDSLKWLVSCPRFSGVVFDLQGMPVRIETVDPRAFVLHKWHVSRREDRDPVKRRRDEAQARLVAKVVATELPHLGPGPAICRLFPREVSQSFPHDDDLAV